MPKLNTQRLSLGAVAGQLYVWLGCEGREDQILAAFLHSGAMSLSNGLLNSLHSVVRRKSPTEQLQVLLEVGFQDTVARWLQQDEVVAGELERGLSVRSQQQMVELIEVIVSTAAESAEEMQGVLLVSQQILTRLFRIVERTENGQLRSTYLDCISKIFRVRPDVFNFAIYAEMLAATDEKVEEFYEFMDYYLLQVQGQQWDIIRFVLEGMSRRMRRFAEKGVLTKGERRGIIKAYLKLIDYLRMQIHTLLPQRVLNEHPEIFEWLQSFVSREFNHHELSRVFSGLVAVYMGSRVGNLCKFEFVLGTFKHILLRSSSLFSFLATQPLANEDFLAWFFSTELTLQRGREVLQCYLKNSASLEFLLVMAIYYLLAFPQRAQEVGNYIRVIGLLEEAKCYLHRDVIKEYFQVFYNQIHEAEFFDDFMNRVEDRAYRVAE